MKPAVFPLRLALLTAALAAGGCHRQPATQLATGAAAAHAPAIGIAQARLVLPAVPGNPGAAYLTIANHGTAPATLLRIDIAGAQAAQMHETSGTTMQALARLPIAPGQQAVFAPGGRHIMAFQIAPTLAAGHRTMIMLHFQDGRTVSAPLAIQAAGGGSDDMAGMDMGGKP